MSKKRFDVAWLRNVNIAISISKQIKDKTEQLKKMKKNVEWLEFE